MPYAVSKDGTRIAYEKTGQGPAIVMVNGALAHRKFYGGEGLAARLLQEFTFIDYDRRGRGESTDTHPYAVDREIEDIEALINEAGSCVFLYGISSGAALALLAAAELGPARVSKLALFEPPYGSDDEKARLLFAGQKKRIGELIDKGNHGDAVAFFIASMGTPPGTIEEMRKTPDWKVMEGVEHTLAYDFAVMGDGSVPRDIAKTVTIPTLVLDGEKSFELMHEAADALGKAIPHAIRKTLPNQTHDVSADALAPVLKEFFAPAT